MVHSTRTARESWRICPHKKGVKQPPEQKCRVGEAHRPGGAKDPNAYRVVYGDLSVKDISPEKLPLPVEP
jgi:hypothetical protein